MNISIVIPVINEADQIRQSISRAWASGADQVIVVDGGSSDDTSAIAATEKCQLVNSCPGRAAQMNRGAAVSTADVLVFLHADNWLVPGPCEQIRSALADHRINYGGFRQKIECESRIYRWIESGNELRVKWQGLIYGDQAFFIRADKFEHAGGFPDMLLMEDFELSKTLWKTGKPIILPGPTFVSARRWQNAGPIRQTVRNWFLSLAYRMGASPVWLATRYRRHDQ